METAKEIEDLQKRVFKAYTVLPVEELYARENNIKYLEAENAELKVAIKTFRGNGTTGNQHKMFYLLEEE